MKDYKIVPRNEDENKEYKNLIVKANDALEEAISHIRYCNKFKQENNFKVNELIINKIEDMIYDLEELEDVTLYKPVKVEE